MATQEDILEAIAEGFGVTVGDIKVTDSLKSQSDPIQLGVMFDHVSERFDIHFTLEEKLAVETVQELIAEIEDKQLE